MKKLTFKFFLIYILPVIVWGGVIFSFSAFPTTPTSEFYWKDFIVKKTAHLVEYGIFSILLYRLFLNSKMPKLKAFTLAVALSFLYGMSDEYHQSFTPGRGPAIRDVGFDTIGAILGGYFVWKLLPKTPKTLRDWGKKLALV